MNCCTSLVKGQPRWRLGPEMIWGTMVIWTRVRATAINRPRRNRHPLPHHCRPLCVVHLIASGTLYNAATSSPLLGGTFLGLAFAALPFARAAVAGAGASSASSISSSSASSSRSSDVLPRPLVCLAAGAPPLFAARFFAAFVFFATSASSAWSSRPLALWSSRI